jgi:hypothetical protein
MTGGEDQKGARKPIMINSIQASDYLTGYMYSAKYLLKAGNMGIQQT